MIEVYEMDVGHESLWCLSGVRFERALVSEVNSPEEECSQVTFCKHSGITHRNLNEERLNNLSF